MDFIRKTRFGMVGITLNEDHAVLKSKDLPAEIIRGTFDDPDTVVKVYHAQIDEIDANIHAMKAGTASVVEDTLDWTPPLTF